MKNNFDFKKMQTVPIDLLKSEKKFLTKYKGEKIVKDLLLTDDEILANSFKIKQAVDSYYNCLKNKNECGNGGYHYILYRNEKQIEIKIEECKRNRQQQTLKKVMDNYWFKEITAIDYEFNLNDVKKYKNELNEIKDLIINMKQNIYILNEDNTFSHNFFAVTNELANNEYTIGFLNMIDFSAYVSAITFDKNNNIYTFIDQLKNVDILILDEIGNEKFRWFINTNLLYSVLNHRDINKKPTVFISQYDLTDLKKQYALQAYKEKINIDHFVQKIKNIINKKIYKF